MTNTNSDNMAASSEFKRCGGKTCNKAGTIQLTVKFINKKGWFCESCRRELEMDGLVLSNK